MFGYVYVSLHEQCANQSVIDQILSRGEYYFRNIRSVGLKNIAAAACFERPTDYGD